MGETIIEQLIAIIQARGAKEADGEITNLRKSVAETAEQFTVLSATSGLALAGITRLIAGVQSLIKELYAVSGIGTAAEFLDIQQALENLTGSAAAAKELFGQLEQISLSSVFDVGKLADFSAELMNTGDSAKQAASELQKLVDLSAKFRMPGESQDGFIQSIIGLKDREKVPARMLARLGLHADLGKIVGAGLGQGQLTTQQAQRRLEGMTGKKAYETLIKGAEAIAGGAAAMQAMTNPLEIVTILFRRLAFAMEPTGEMLLKVLIPLGTFLSDIVDTFRIVNEASGGLTGLYVVALSLIIGVATLVASFKFLWKTGAVVTGTIDELSLALQLLNATLEQSATAATEAAAANGLSGASKALVPVGGAVGAGEAAAGAAGAEGMLATLLPKLLAGLNFLVFIPIISQIVGSFVKGDGKSKGRAFGGDLITNAGTGAGIGGFIGSVVPVVGTAVGAAIGGVLGALYTAANYLFGGKHDDTTSELKKQTGILQNIESKLIGGGEQARRVISEIEIERSVATALGVGG